jgi:hypothetical protein
LSCSDDEEPPAHATAAPSTSPAAVEEPDEPAVVVRATRSTVRKVPQSQTQNPKRTKKTKEVEVSLEAHVSAVSSDDVSDSFFLLFLLYFHSLIYSFSSGFDEEIRRFRH